MSDQATLFGPAPPPKQKAKALPKLDVQPKPPTVASRLSPQQQHEAAANIATLQNQRVRLKVGDIEMADGACEECGGERIRELVDIRPSGCRLWEARCLKCVRQD